MAGSVRCVGWMAGTLGKKQQLLLFSSLLVASLLFSQAHAFPWCAHSLHAPHFTHSPLHFHTRSLIFPTPFTSLPPSLSFPPTPHSTPHLVSRITLRISHEPHHTPTMYGQSVSIMRRSSGTIFLARAARNALPRPGLHTKPVIPARVQSRQV
jgi:hypothetical protein